MSGLPREGDLYGRFRIRRLIGRGGMGAAVFEAYDPTLRRLVALKVVLPGSADMVDVRERADREAQLLARVRSSHIVHIHDVGRQDDSVYVVAELAPDADLFSWLAEEDHGQRPEPGFLTANFESSYSSTTADGSRKTPDRRVLVMLGVVAIALTAIALGGYAIARGGDGTDKPSASTASSKGPAEPATTPVSTATAGVVGATQTPSVFTCWDGAVVSSADQCRPPHGTRGIYWVFPGMDGQNCRPRTADNTPGRVELLECYLNDRRVKIHLSLWDGADAGISHYTDQESLGQPQVNTDANGVPILYGWQGVAQDPAYPYQGVLLWSTHAYSAAVYVASNAELASVLEHPTLLKPVPDDRYFGTPAG
jgi:hypothetical protein